MVDPFHIIDVEINDISLKIPMIVHELFQYIESNISEGIFRINGSLKKINQYYNNLHKFKKFLKNPDTSIYDICSLIKKILTYNFDFVNADDLNLTGDFLQDIKNFNEFINFNLPRTSVEVFIYSIHFISNLLKYDETKMTIMNYSIIFQPIFLPSNNLLLLPNYINLLKSIIENKLMISIINSRNSSIVSELSMNLPDHYAGTTSNPNFSKSTTTTTTNTINGTRNNSFIDSHFFKNFKNFKNKSIDSINDSLKFKISNNQIQAGAKGDILKFKGYKLNNGSMTFVEQAIDPESLPIRQSTPIDDDVPHDKSPLIEQIGEVEEKADEQLLESEPVGEEQRVDDENKEEQELNHDNEDHNDQDNEPQTEEKEVPISLSPARVNIEPNLLDLQNNTIPEIESIKDDIRDTKRDSDLNSINKLCKLDSINENSFQFNINLDDHSILSNTSYHSLNPQSNDYTKDDDNYNNHDNDDDDNEININEINHINDIDDTFDTLDSNEPITEANTPVKSHHKKTSISQSIRSFQKSKNENKTDKVDKKKRNSIINLSPLDSNVNKRKSFISIFKNDGVKRNFTLKFKPRSVY